MMQAYLMRRWKIIRDAFKIKSPYRGTLSQSQFTPIPPFKSREQNRKDIFWTGDPLPPLKTREIKVIIV